jgi:hypothetical protein
MRSVPVKAVLKSGVDELIGRLKDVARVEVGALAYSTNSFLSGKPAVPTQLLLRPGAYLERIASRPMQQKQFQRARLPCCLRGPATRVGQPLHENYLEREVGSPDYVSRHKSLAAAALLHDVPHNWVLAPEDKLPTSSTPCVRCVRDTTLLQRQKLSTA